MTVVDGNLNSNVGDEAARSARLYLNQKWQDGLSGGHASLKRDHLSLKG